MSSSARGATMTPPITIREVRRQKTLTNPWRNSCIFARALVARGSMIESARTSPASTCACVAPTVAISGREYRARHRHAFEGLHGIA